MSEIIWRGKIEEFIKLSSEVTPKIKTELGEMLINNFEINNNIMTFFGGEHSVGDIHMTAELIKSKYSYYCIFLKDKEDNFKLMCSEPELMRI